MNKKRVILIVLVFLMILIIAVVCFFNYSKITGKVIVSCGNLLCESGENPLVCPDDCLINKYLVYADTYRTIKNGTTNEYFTIGHYDFFDNNQVKIHYFFYDANKNKPEGTTNRKHNKLNAPYGGNCSQGYIHIPSYEEYKQFNGTWTIEGDLLKIQIGSVIHEWRLEDSENKFFKLNKPYYNSSTSLPIINGATFTNTIGFGYIGDKVLLKDSITRDNLFNKYEGEMYQNNNLSTSNWIYYPSSTLSVYVFSAENDLNVLGYSYPCGYSGHTNMWCLSTLLLNYAPYSKLLIYHNGGHDYNEDGCYNELGHRKQMFGIMENSKITKMVFIEYSYEHDGYPLIGIGRYYSLNCLDGTLNNKCSINRPLFCLNGSLINNCSICGCSDNKTCSENSECVTSEPVNQTQNVTISVNQIQNVTVNNNTSTVEVVSTLNNSAVLRINGQEIKINTGETKKIESSDNNRPTFVSLNKINEDGSVKVSLSEVKKSKFYDKFSVYLPVGFGLIAVGIVIFLIVSFLKKPKDMQD